MVGQSNQAAAVNSSMANSSALLGTSMSGNLHDAVKQGELGKEPRGPGEENEVPGKSRGPNHFKILRRSARQLIVHSLDTSSKSRQTLPKKRQHK